MDPDAARGRTLVEESREAVVVLDDRDTVLLASRRARQSIDGLAEGDVLPAGGLSGEPGLVPPVWPSEGVAAGLGDRAARAGVVVWVEGDPTLELPLRPRMLRVIAQNLAENAIRYAGPGSTFTLAVERIGDEIVLRGADDGVGASEAELGRVV